uniref:Uncharacterized protein n=1 Tax=Oryza brachyantha TaxID=4533 RepID=J3LUH3_ORYBR
QGLGLDSAIPGQCIFNVSCNKKSMCGLPVTPSGPHFRFCSPNNSTVCIFMYYLTLVSRFFFRILV